MNSSNIFFETQETPEIIIGKLKKGEWNDILNSLCKVDANSMYLDYIYFKYFATKETYGILTNYIISHINNICPYCNKEIKISDEYHGDHIIAWSAGGETLPDNLQVLHKRCHQLKSIR